MAFFEFPHTRTYEGDLGFILKQLDQLTKDYNTFFKYNTIKFADPIEWDITRQYPAFTIVFDTEDMISLISKQPVPAGIDISNGDYWSFVGPLIVDGQARTSIERILRFITNSYESDEIAASYHLVGSYLVNAGELYKVTSAINIGDHITDGFNVTKVSVETMIHEIFNAKTPTIYAYIDNAILILKNSLEQSINDIEGDVTSIFSTIDAIQNSLNTANDRITSLNQGLTQEINNRTSADNNLGARIDNLAHLSEGSTTGDAELIDGRVGGDGITYSSIGNAIRAQYANFDNYLDYYLETDFDVMSDKSCGYYSADGSGNLTPRPGTFKDLRYMDNNITTNGRKFVHFEIKSGYMASLLEYAADNTYLGSSGWKTSSLYIQLNPNTAYINIGCTKTPYSTSVVITDDEAKMNVKTDLTNSTGGNTFVRTTINYLTPNNFSGVLDDFNDAYDNVVYVFHNMNVYSAHPLNYPDRFISGDNLKRSILKQFTTPDGLVIQEFIAAGVVAIRSCFNSIWTDWEYLTDTPRIIYCSKQLAGYNYYSSFKDACDAAYLVRGSKIIVLDGTYDLVSEFGQTYLDNLASSPLEPSGFGCKVGNDMRIEFRNGSKLEFNYTGTNQVTQKLFSPLHVMSAHPGFEVDGANIYAKNCRYCIHLEAGNYNNYYKQSVTNCILELDNSDPGTNVNVYTYACIGAGCGVQCDFVIANNKCTSHPYVNGNIDYSDPESAQEVIFSHTSAAGSTQLNQIFTNNIVVGGTIICRGYNDVNETLAIVSNNQVNYAPQLETVTGGMSNLINFNEFNNDVVSY